MNYSEWIRAEADKWVADEIITPEQSEQIKLKYPEAKAANQLVLVFSIIGSLLVGTGIILILATNWWNLPLMIKVILAFLPLVTAQGICIFTFKRKFYSAAFREGSTIFLSLSFFAALALIGQIFHMPSDLQSFVLVCILFSLPGIYLFRAKAVLAIYVAGALFVSWDAPGWMSMALTLLVLPFFYLEFTQTKHKDVLNYLLFLCTLMMTNTVLTLLIDDAEILETALACGLVALFVDAAFRKISNIYFFTWAKRISIFCITATLLIAAFSLSYRDNMTAFGCVAVVGTALLYAAIRYSTVKKFASTDLFALAAVMLTLSASVAGIMANVLLAAMGVFYIVRGSKSLALGNLNFGMLLVLFPIGMRFFDSSASLLGRGVVFVLLGAVFLGVNIYISRRKGASQ